jgi:hypothetical protein
MLTCNSVSTSVTGGVVGGLSIVALLTVVLGYIWRRTRRKIQDSESSSGKSRPPRHVTFAKLPKKFILRASSESTESRTVHTSHVPSLPETSHIPQLSFEPWTIGELSPRSSVEEALHQSMRSGTTIDASHSRTRSRSSEFGSGLEPAGLVYPPRPLVAPSKVQNQNSLDSYATKFIARGTTSPCCSCQCSPMQSQRSSAERDRGASPYWHSERGLEVEDDTSFVDTVTQKPVVVLRHPSLIKLC